MRIDVQLESSYIVHILVVDLGLLQLVVEDPILKGLEHLVPDIQVNVELLHIRNQVFPNQTALHCIDVLQKLRLKQTYQTALVIFHQLQLGLRDRLVKDRRNLAQPIPLSVIFRSTVAVGIVVLTNYSQVDF